MLKNRYSDYHENLIHDSRNIKALEHMLSSFNQIEKDGILANNSVFIGKTWVVCPQCGKEIVLERSR